MTILLLFAWLILPTLVAGWYLIKSRDGDDPEVAQQRAQLSAVTLISVLAVASILFRLMNGTGLAQTAALFVGIPAILASAAVFIPTRSAMGVACKSVTIGLGISLIFLGEGMLCVLLSAPLFYLIALVVGGLIDYSRRSQNRYNILGCLGLLAVLPMSLEGVSPFTTIARDTVVSETRLVHAPATAVAAALIDAPRFDRALPALLAKGFPRPIATTVDGNIVEVRMRGGEMRLNGMEPRAGTLVLERVEARPGFVSWRATSDDSHMRHFLTWQSSDVEWQAIDAETTKVTWSVRYRRDLDPAWYFGPMERYAVRLAAGYLIDSVATP